MENKDNNHKLKLYTLFRLCELEPFTVDDLNYIVCFYLPAEDYDFLLERVECLSHNDLHFISLWLKYSPHIKTKIINNKSFTYVNELLHSIFDLPAIVEYTNCNDGTLLKTEEHYYKCNVLHRLSKYGPASIYYNTITGKKQYELYYEENKLNRDVDLPAVIEYDKNGVKTYEAYYKIGKLHRLNNPALIYHSNEKRIREQYHQNGNLHRPKAEGPAIIDYNNVNGEQRKVNEEFWEYGKELQIERSIKFFGKKRKIKC